VAHFSHCDAEQHILMDMLCVIILSDTILLTVILIVGMLGAISPNATMLIVGMLIVSMLSAVILSAYYY
jgi:hypothetical protein